MIRLPSFWPFKKPDPAPDAPQEASGVTAGQLRDIQQFTNGYLLAMTHGTQDLEEHLINAAAEQALARLEPTILARAEQLGQLHARPLLTLQQKWTEFSQKRAAATTEADRIKYGHYLEALEWMLNGH